MDAVEWADDHWILLSFAADLVLCLGAVLRWNSGTRPFTGLLFVFALVLPLALATVRFTDWVLEQDERDEAPRRGSD